MIFPSSLLIAASLATAALAAPSTTTFTQYQQDLITTNNTLVNLNVAFEACPGTSNCVNVSSFPSTHCVLALPANARIVGHTHREWNRGQQFLSFDVRLQCETIQLILQRLTSRLLIFIRPSDHSPKNKSKLQLIS
jgi:hypothetical protein